MFLNINWHLDICPKKLQKKFQNVKKCLNVLEKQRMLLQLKIVEHHKNANALNELHKHENDHRRSNPDVVPRVYNFHVYACS